MKKNEENSMSDDDILIFGAYTRIAYSLQHSNCTQLTYKKATLTWIIATYVGIGYSPSSFEVNLPLNPLLAIATICLASLLVLIGIWYLDLIVEEKKIASAVHNGIQLEKKYPKLLPNTYQNVVNMNYLLGYVFMKSVFYLAFASILLITICASVTSYLFIENNKLWWIFPPVTALAIVFLFFIANWMTKKNNPYPVLDKLHKHKGFHGN